MGTLAAAPEKYGIVGVIQPSGKERLMRHQSSFKRELIQWLLAAALAVGGLLIWRMTTPQAAHADRVNSLGYCDTGSDPGD
jgi:hypothetical protein